MHKAPSLGSGGNTAHPAGTTIEERSPPLASTITRMTALARPTAMAIDQSPVPIIDIGSTRIGAET